MSSNRKVIIGLLTDNIKNDTKVFDAAITLRDQYQDALILLIRTNSILVNSNDKAGSLNELKKAFHKANAENLELLIIGHIRGDKLSSTEANELAELILSATSTLDSDITQIRIIDCAEDLTNAIKYSKSFIGNMPNFNLKQTGNRLGEHSFSTMERTTTKRIGFFNRQAEDYHQSTSRAELRSF
ncbi:MAG: hypothetical protein JXR42_02915 [Gammaproteobacteria bacterium]|nr:hypothetical protein [Gammaproteobacteria bacterium]